MKGKSGTADIFSMSCRFCAKETRYTEKLIKLDDDPNMIKKLIPWLQISENDKLPKKICLRCKFAVDQWDGLTRTISNSERKFNLLLREYEKAECKKLEKGSSNKVAEVCTNNDENEPGTFIKKLRAKNCDTASDNSLVEQMRGGKTCTAKKAVTTNVVLHDKFATNRVEASKRSISPCEDPSTSQEKTFCKMSVTSNSNVPAAIIPNKGNSSDCKIISIKDRISGDTKFGLNKTDSHCDAIIHNGKQLSGDFIARKKSKSREHTIANNETRICGGFHKSESKSDAIPRDETDSTGDLTAHKKRKINDYSVAFKKGERKGVVLTFTKTDTNAEKSDSAGDPMVQKGEIICDDSNSFEKSDITSVPLTLNKTDISGVAIACDKNSDAITRDETDNISGDAIACNKTSDTIARDEGDAEVCSEDNSVSEGGLLSDDFKAHSPTKLPSEDNLCEEYVKSYFEYKVDEKSYYCCYKCDITLVDAKYMKPHYLVCPKK